MIPKLSALRKPCSMLYTKIYHTWNGMHGLRIKAYDTNDTKESIPNDHKP